jgi:glycosyltransferase involved in cell wall biosynthesis
MAPHPGGIERFLAELLPAQRRAGVLTAALVHAEGRAGSHRCRFQARSAVIRAPVLATLAYTPVSPSWPIRLQRLITRWQPDLLHLHLPNPSAFWALALPAARAIPWVVHWHADVPADALDARLRVLYRLYRPLEDAVLRRARTIIATSAAYADSSAPLRRWRSKVAVVPLGMADLSPASPEPDAWPTGTGQRLLFVGRFSYYKGLEHLIDALAPAHGAKASSAEPLHWGWPIEWFSPGRCRMPIWPARMPRRMSCACRRSSAARRSEWYCWKRCEQACRVSPPPCRAAEWRP